MFFAIGGIRGACQVKHAGNKEQNREGEQANLGQEELVASGELHCLSAIP